MDDSVASHDEAPFDASEAEDFAPLDDAVSLRPHMSGRLDRSAEGKQV
jgi:hypothetical protein